MVLFLGVLLLCLNWMNNINQALYQEDLRKKTDNALKLAQNAIQDEKEKALSIALMLSKKETIHHGYATNNRKIIFNELQNIIKELKQNITNQPIDIQMHSKDLHSYVQSWDYNSYGLPLSNFRKGLIKVKQTKKPYASIELGKRLNIKAIAPILQNQNFIGSTEVIFGFEHIEEKLSQNQVRFIVLLEMPYLQLATNTKQYDIVSHYAQLTNSCKNECLEALKLGFHKIQNNYFEEPKFVFGFTPLFNYDNRQIGLIGVAVQKENIPSNNIFNPLNDLFHSEKSIQIDQEAKPTKLGEIIVQ